LVLHLFLSFIFLSNSIEVSFNYLSTRPIYDVHI
jgi:hypothetical protein